MIKDRELFKTISNNVTDVKVATADATENTIEGTGDVDIIVGTNNDVRATITLKDCFSMPQYARNLISVEKIVDNGGQAVSGDSPKVIAPDGTEIPIELEGDLYVWRATPPNSKQTSNTSIYNWHLRMGHNNEKDLRQLQKKVKGMHISDSETQLSCDICLTQKAKRVNVPKHVGTRASKAKEIVHTVVLGPLEESIDGHRYAINFIDSFSRFGAVYFMKTRTEVTEKFKQFTPHYQAPKTIVTDGAKEFTSEVFEKNCRDKGVRHEISSPYTPEENWKSERLWSTLMNTTRCLLSSAIMPNTFWTYALNHAMFVKNRCIHSSIDCTSFE